LLLPLAPPPPWDAARAYTGTAPGVDIFFKSHPCKPLPIKAALTPAAAVQEPKEDLAHDDVRWVLCPVKRRCWRQ
jgi:hypothetical protein